MNRALPALAAALLLASSRLPAQDPVIAAAGDIACDPADPGYNGGQGTATACRMKATSDLLVGASDTAVLVLGDNQYQDGTLAKYLASYDPTWGRLKATTKPAPGNHEYNSAGAAGYYAYFGAAAGDASKGWYSFDLGSWHVVVLNSSCAAVGGCGAGSPQETWLKADLAANARPCTLAVWHQPRFSSGLHGDDAAYDAFWRALYAAGADVVLNGHDHEYERFAPQDPDGALDTGKGIRQFVVGTGGYDLRTFPVIRANSEVRDNTAFGILRMTLKPAGYEWHFVPAPPATFTDSGTGVCHRAVTPLSLHTLTPCRLADTRLPDGPSGGPALAANTTRSFPVVSVCGIPPTARAVAVNVKGVGSTDVGDFRLGPSGQPPPLASVVNFRPGKTPSSNTIAPLGADGAVAVTCDMPAGSSGTVHFVLDVTGWFE